MRFTRSHAIAVESAILHDSTAPDLSERISPIPPVKSVFRDLMVSSGLYCVTLLWLLISRAFSAEFADYPDEAGHYITGLLFHDYLASFHYLSPLKFAESFYVHYPKVALGHWPPVFYLIQAAWTLVFPISHSSLLLMMAAITTVLAFLIYRMLLPELGHWVSFAAACIFTALPVVQRQTGRLMADTLVSLFMLLAALCFGRFIDSERAKDAIWFGIWSAIAILTKGNAWALALMPPTAILIARKWKLLVRPALWCSAAIVLVSCGPWYWLTFHISNGGWEPTSDRIHYFVSALAYFGVHMTRTLGWGFTALAVVGFVFRCAQLLRGSNVRGIWSALCGLFFGCMIIFCSIPAGLEERYLLPAVIAAFAFAFVGIVSLVSKLPVERFKPVLVFAVPLAIVLFATAGFSFARPTRGYAALANALLSNSRFSRSVILIASDSDGEGSFISEMAMHEHRPGHIILRGSQVLARGNWNGYDARLIFHSPEQVSEYLDSVPVGIVILDSSSSNPNFLIYENLLVETMAVAPRRWKLFGSYAVWKNGVNDANALRVYIRTAASAHPLGLIQVNVPFVLGKRLIFSVEHP